MNKLLLKKYTNRRLYDTQKSIYVTLDYVSCVIRQGRQIVVVDVKTGKDVTAAVLMQIVSEEARKKNYLLPNPLLYLIIQYGETVLSEFFDKYLEFAIKNYLLFHDLADNQYKQWLDMNACSADSNKQTLNNLASFQSLFDVFTGNKEEKDDKENSLKNNKK